jgi:Ku C terminal domain like
VLQKYYHTVSWLAIRQLEGDGSAPADHAGDPRVAVFGPRPERPPMDEAIEQAVLPLPSVLAKAEGALRNVKDLFPLQKSEEVARQEQRVYWREVMTREASDSGVLQLESYVGAGLDKQNDVAKSADAIAAGHQSQKKTGGTDMTLEDVIRRGGVRSVGSATPVEDFNEMMSRRDVDLVDDAISGMRKVILQIIETSLGAQLYPKAFECLVAMRAGCVREAEVEVYNEFAEHIRSSFAGKRRDDFWVQMVQFRGNDGTNLGLITQDECDDSEVTATQAADFFASNMPAAAPAAAPRKPAEADEADDLLDMMD